MRLSVGLLAFVALHCVYAAPLSSIQPTVSDVAGARLLPLDPIPWTTDVSGSWSSDVDLTLTIDDTVTYQRFDGLGGSFERSGALLLSRMPETVQTEILTALFDPVQGAGFALGKVSIGGTDFQVPANCTSDSCPSWYTYADEPQDASLPKFSIDIELDPVAGLVPYVIRASAIAGRALRLEATMDYPPAWMLNTTSVMPHGDLNRTQLSAFANYFWKYSQAMTEAGVPVEFISFFNELDGQGDISLGRSRSRRGKQLKYMNASYEVVYDWLINHVGPLFRSKPDAPKITWTEMFGRRETAVDAPAFFSRPGVLDFTDAIFYHGYDCNYGIVDGQYINGGWTCDNLNTTCPRLDESAALLRDFIGQFAPNKPVWLTELCYATEFGDYNVSLGCAPIPRLDFQDAMQWGRMMYADFNIVGASGWLYWNMVLDQNGGPWVVSPEHDDPDQNVQQPLIVVNTETGTWQPTGAYYAMAHTGHFVSAGQAVRVQASRSRGAPSNLLSIAWRMSDSMAVILMNDANESRTVRLQFRGQSALVTVSPISYTTLVFAC